MGTVNYTYEPNDPVWVITGGDCPSAVEDGVVSYVRINITALGSPAPTTEILYDIVLGDDNGPTTFIEADVFPSLPAAVAEYETRLTPTGSP